MIHHFRYRRGLLDQRLASLLSDQPGHLRPELKDLAVVVVYFYQEQSGGEWKVQEGAYVPVRCGRLIEAYFDGEVAHFYFAVGDYVKETKGDFSARVLLNQDVSFVADKKERIFALEAKALPISAGANADASAFQNFVDASYVPGEWRTRSVGVAPLDVTYDIVFLRIDGIFRERGEHLERLEAVLRGLIGNPLAEFELESGVTYHIKVITHLHDKFPALLPGQGRARLKLAFDPEVLKAIGPTSFSISSAYDLHYWSVLVASPAGRRSVLSVVCEHNNSLADGGGFLRRELACPEISLPISIVSPPSQTAA